jgi:excisionase family DNA binding protein
LSWEQLPGYGETQLKKNHSIFDYSITITRKHRYLVISCPAFGFELSSHALKLDRVDSFAIGDTVLRMFDRIHREFLKYDQLGVPPPKPFKSLGLHSSRMISAGEAARVLGMSRSTLKKAVAAGQVFAEKTPGGHLRIHSGSLVSYLAENGAAYL